MFGVKYHVVYFAIIVVFGRVNSLVELPKVEENVIQKTELIIRTTTNALFSNLKLHTKKERPRIKYFALIHYYLCTLTLQDYTSLIEIAKLTRVDKNTINNETQDFIAILNELFNDENQAVRNNKLEDIDEADKFIIDYMNELERKVNNTNYNFDVDKEILKLLFTEDELNANDTIHNNDLENLEVWRPTPDLLPSLGRGILDEHNPQELILSDSRRIFNGETTKIKYYPFMASVLVFEEFTCAGSIIKSDLVITAASCLQLAYNNRLFRENPAFLSVRIGSTFFSVTGEVVPVMEVYFHPGYNPRKLKNNLAIMRLQRRINFKNKHVKKIKIYTDDGPVSAKTDGILVLGWGAKTESNKLYSAMSNRLSASLLDSFPQHECKKLYGSEYVTKENFCAGYLTQGGGACNHDLGGPGIVDGVLVGVISFGASNCGEAGSPTVFTKLSIYADWIEKIMEAEAPVKLVRTTTLKSWHSSEAFPDATDPYMATIIPIAPFNDETELPVFIVNLDHKILRTPLSKLTTSKMNMKDIYNIFSSVIQNQTKDILRLQPKESIGNQDILDTPVSITIEKEVASTTQRAFDMRTMFNQDLFTPELSQSDEEIEQNTKTTKNKAAHGIRWDTKDTNSETGISLEIFPNNLAVENDNLREHRLDEYGTHTNQNKKYVNADQSDAEFDSVAAYKKLLGLKSESTAKVAHKVYGKGTSTSAFDRKHSLKEQMLHNKRITDENWMDNKSAKEVTPSVKSHTAESEKDLEKLEKHKKWSLLKPGRNSNESDIDLTLLTLLYLSENEKDKEIDSLLDNATLALIGSDYLHDSLSIENLKNKENFVKSKSARLNLLRSKKKISNGLLHRTEKIAKGNKKTSKNNKEDQGLSKTLPDIPKNQQLSSESLFQILKQGLKMKDKQDKKLTTHTLPTAKVGPLLKKSPRWPNVGWRDEVA